MGLDPNDLGSAPRDPDSIPWEWLPSIHRRYLATTIDALLVLAAVLTLRAVLPDDELSRSLLISVVVFGLLVYEPVGSGRCRTVGQWVTGVRVRRMRDGRKIGIPRAWLRIIVKTLVGALSSVILPFVPGKRALHDFATGSIVILARSERDFQRWTAAPPRTRA